MWRNLRWAASQTQRKWDELVRWLTGEVVNMLDNFVCMCVCLGLSVGRWWLCWHWPIGSSFWTLFNALTDTHTHHAVAEHTFRAHTNCTGSLVCEFRCHWGIVQLVWQQDIDSWTILMFASPLYGYTCTHPPKALQSCEGQPHFASEIHILVLTAEHVQKHTQTHICFVFVQYIGFKKCLFHLHPLPFIHGL